MKYFSADIETTGLDPEKDQILSIGVILEDTEKKLPFEEIPKFHAAILHKEIHVSPFAINMNSKLISFISSYLEMKSEDSKKALEETAGMIFCREDEVVKHLYYFMYDCEMVPPDEKLGGGMMEMINGKGYPAMTSNMKPVHLNIAGKNFGTFDKLLLEKLPRWKQAFRVRQRILDPSIFFVDWTKDAEVPGLGKCKQRAGIEDHKVAHDAIADAWDVITLLRTQY